MIELPADWIQQPGVQVLSAYPPGLGARMRYFERLRPQPSFATIVKTMLATDPEFVVRDVGELVRVVTREGEYGAWTAIDGRRQGSRAMRFIGAAFLDEFAAALDVIAVIPEHFAKVEELAFELVRAQRFQLAQRPRRFFYVPPAGWQGIASGLVATWMPPDFPNNATSIVVPPAQHAAAVSGDAIEEACAGLGAGLDAEPPSRTTVTSSTGVAGVSASVVGVRAGRAIPVHRELVMFASGSYVYALKLEAASSPGLAEQREVFLAVACSFRPLPTADEMRLGTAFASPADVFDHWIQ